MRPLPRAIHRTASEFLEVRINKSLANSANRHSARLVSGSCRHIILPRTAISILFQGFHERERNRTCIMLAGNVARRGILSYAKAKAVYTRTRVLGASATAAGAKPENLYVSSMHGLLQERHELQSTRTASLASALAPISHP